jgi:hypothetical protein
MARKTQKKTQTEAERLAEFRGRFTAFLNPAERRAKVRLVPPAHRISQARLAAVDSLRTGILTCLKAWEMNQESLTDDFKRGVPVEPGKLVPYLGKNEKGDVVLVKAVL